MARRVVNRKEKRAEIEAAEQAGITSKEVPVKKKPARKTASKAAAEVRLKAYWGVFNQALRRVALYEYADKKKAEKKAQELSESGKSPHFIQPVKEIVKDQ